MYVLYYTTLYYIILHYNGGCFVTTALQAPRLRLTRL